MTDPFREHLQSALSSAYELERELTGGGMSRVFVAREHALGRTVVVKVLPPELAAGVNRERFRREIQLAAGLHHPHIVPVLSAGELVLQGVPAAAGGELLYYTMPFIDGESLRTTLERRGRLPVREVVRILHDVVDALAYAHGRGIVHRDIKPGNILTLGSHALVTDFGVAKALSAAMPVAGVTTSGMAIGTPAYMAPEQLAGDPAADHRVDIYATGLLAYELLTGESPFTGPSPQATMAAQLTRVPEPLDRCCPDVPPALSAVIMRCLEKLPEARPQSAQALLEELEAVTITSGETAARATAGAAAPSPAEPPAPAATPSPRRRRWPAGLLAVGGVALAAIAAAAVMLDGSRGRAGEPAARPRSTVSSAAPADSTRVGVTTDSAPRGAVTSGAQVGASVGGASVGA
ncbi:MAG TPA: serine/threonine-protein kinase, partial [Gemmatimonadaceae bacterium]|nr:serine/threonine-protein kinase [Gemmatimonadaceae bacterium]